MRADIQHAINESDERMQTIPLPFRVSEAL